MNWSKKSFLLTLLTTAILTLTFTPASAQNLRRIERQAIAEFENGNFIEARDKFQTLFKFEWNIYNTSSYLASCYLELDEPLKAYEILAHVSNPDELNTYLRILSCYYLEFFDEAEMLIESFPDSAGFDIEDLKKRVARAKESYSQGDGILVQNFGENINSENLEYSAVMYNDFNKLLFTSRKGESAVTDVDGLAFETIYSTEIDSADNWKKATPLNIETEKKKSHDATVQVYQAGKKMISYKDGQLYSSTLKDGVWSKDEDFVIHEGKGSDTHCFITKDEKTIFFASDYKSEGKHLDLFVSQKMDNGGWSEPKPLEIFNTEYDEDSPFLATDSTFYFSSRGHNSIGGFDVFKSTFDHEKNQWGPPENLGYPINTVAEDIYYTTEGKLAYLSSTRLEGYGSLDLYRVYHFNKVKVEGKLVDDNKQPIPDALIDVKYDSTTLRSYTDEEGNYEIFVPINKKMHITFIKDSLNLFEGDYIANIFFKDENQNEFNFFIDYMSSDPGIIKSNEDNKTVKHINVDIRNDYEENPIIASIPKNEESLWSDSVNYVAKTKKIEELQSREISFVDNKDGDIDILSSHLKLREATVQVKQKETKDQSTGIASTTQVPGNQSSDYDGGLPSGYTVQVLAMPIKRKPESSFFDKLGDAEVRDRDGSDGLKRFFTGVYDSFEEAKYAMKMLRKTGYSDAFVRKLSKYEEL
ncbi:MAG: SPOR domain-containing protein [Cyclobacteriaceae bacterium]